MPAPQMADLHLGKLLDLRLSAVINKLRTSIWPGSRPGFLCPGSYVPGIPVGKRGGGLLSVPPSPRLFGIGCLRTVCVPRLCRVFNSGKVFFDLGFGLRNVYIAHYDHGHSVGPVPVAVKVRMVSV